MRATCAAPIMFNVEVRNFYTKMKSQYRINNIINSKMMSGTIRAILKTNKAVSMIKTGEYHEAINRLSNVLNSLKHSVNRATNEYEHQQEPPSSGIDLEEFMLSSNTCQMSIPTRGGGSEQDQEDNPFFYRQPIEIPKSLIGGLLLSSSTNHGDTILLSSVVLFNLALAHHLLAETSNSYQKMFLQKALRLYELSFRMQEQLERVHSNNFHFALAVMNNIGLIHKQMKNDIQAKDFFSQIFSILMVITDSDMEESTRCHLQGYYQNIGLFCQPTSLAAAA